MMMRKHRALLIVFALAAGGMLAGCESFDPDSMFNQKKPLPGDRRAVFPEGVPGVPQGVPQELVQGYQPPAEQPPPEPAPVVEKPKPKPKRVAQPAPRPQRAAPPPQQQAQQPQADQAAPWPAPPQQQQTTQSPFPDPPQPGTFRR
ncbi:MAG: hypothetical protein AB1490_16120 [Pseudomonadota bacterium]